VSLHAGDQVHREIVATRSVCRRSGPVEVKLARSDREVPPANQGT
jgi:hypothetical protein